jgi:hypothetical protein
MTQRFLLQTTEYYSMVHRRKRYMFWISRLISTGIAIYCKCIDMIRENIQHELDWALYSLNMWFWI